MSSAQSPGETFRVEAAGVCTKCQRRTEGWIAFGNLQSAGPLTIVDTGNFMLFAEGLVCDRCLGEGPGPGQ
jgi:hypothetical protein